jgi:hypothetical protein
VNVDNARNPDGGAEEVIKRLTKSAARSWETSLWPGLLPPFIRRPCCASPMKNPARGNSGTLSLTCGLLRKPPENEKPAGSSSPAGSRSRENRDDYLFFGDAAGAGDAVAFSVLVSLAGSAALPIFKLFNSRVPSVCFQ